MRIPLRFRHLLTLAAFAVTSIAVAQNAGISVNGAVPNAAAILDLDVSTGLSGVNPQFKRGLLVPRMTSAQRLAIPVNAADNGLLVYQTDTGTVNSPTNQRGFWYYSSVEPAWIHLVSARVGWSLRGNNPTFAAGFEEYVGTINTSANTNLVIRSVPVPANPAFQMGYELNNYKSGFVGLGTAAPATERLEVEGAIRVANTTNITPPNEGTIRYGTKDGADSSATNLNWHWGTSDTASTINSTNYLYWSRLENAETLITPPKPYLKDTMTCVGDTGEAFRGNLSLVPVTMPIATPPCNYYSPFASNFTSTQTGSFRVQYLYRYSELVDAGLCFPAKISSIAFYCLDQEKLDNPGSPDPFPTTITGEIRGGATSAFGLAGPSGAFSAIGPYMDDVVRQSAIKGSFLALTVAPGWINFPLTNMITLNVGDNLILDVVWSRNICVGVGPRVELEDPGYLCTKWVLKNGGSGDFTDRYGVDDNSPNSGTTAPNDPHSKRPVTRFTGKVKSPSTVAANANYVLYEGGLMIGDATWATPPLLFKGAGTIMAQKGVYDSNVLLSDHVFDRYFDGTVRPEDAKASQGYTYVGLDKLRERLKRDRHLPGMPSRSEWEARGGASLGTITTGLWETVENQSLYISQLEKDLTSLEELTFGNALSPREAQRLITEVQASKRLTEAQKLHLIDALQQKAQPANPKQ